MAALETYRRKRDFARPTTRGIDLSDLEEVPT
jgi:hypothetical protein